VVRGGQRWLKMIKTACKDEFKRYGMFLINFYVLPFSITLGVNLPIFFKMILPKCSRTTQKEVIMGEMLDGIIVV
jgi:hypothetical protein